MSMLLLITCSVTISHISCLGVVDIREHFLLYGAEVWNALSLSNHEVKKIEH
jgi:hypothetical protein